MAVTCGGIGCQLYRIYIFPHYFRAKLHIFLCRHGTCLILTRINLILRKGHRVFHLLHKFRAQISKLGLFRQIIPSFWHCFFPLKAREIHCRRSGCGWLPQGLQRVDEKLVSAVFVHAQSRRQTKQRFSIFSLLCLPFCQIFLQAQPFFIHLCGGLNANIPIMPYFLGNARDVGFISRVTEDKTVFVAVFLQP